MLLVRLSRNGFIRLSGVLVNSKCAQSKTAVRVRLIFSIQHNREPLYVNLWKWKRSRKRGDLISRGTGHREIMWLNVLFGWFCLQILPHFAYYSLYFNFMLISLDIFFVFAGVICLCQCAFQFTSRSVPFLTLTASLFLSLTLSPTPSLFVSQSFCESFHLLPTSIKWTNK